MDDSLNIDLTGIADKGYIRFSIKAEDLPHNTAIHAAFKEFCAVECDNNYTAGLKRLLETYDADAHFEVLWSHIQELQEEVRMLKAASAPKKEKEKSEVF